MLNIAASLIGLHRSSSTAVSLIVLAALFGSVLFFVLSHFALIKSVKEFLYVMLIGMVPNFYAFFINV
jgi:hypothetical protein